jgi:hypothetical protein
MMKYPKSGYHNPIISVHVFKLDRYHDCVSKGKDEAKKHRIKLDWTGKHADENRIVFEVDNCYGILYHIILVYYHYLNKLLDENERTLVNERRNASGVPGAGMVLLLGLSH